MVRKYGSIFLLIVSICCCSINPLYAKNMPGNLQKVKIIGFGGIPGSGGQPSPQELAPNATAVDNLPIQAFTFTLTNAKGYFPDKCMTPDIKYTYDDLSKDIKLMKSFEFKSGMNFFPRINISAELQTDWFDDAGWDIILNNIMVASQASSEVNTIGFILDNEQYNYQPFNYTAQANRAAKSFDQYQAQTRKQGRQFAEALVSYIPKAKFVFMYGNSHIAQEGCKKDDLDKFPMGLWPAFLDGMMDGAPEAEFIDGHENYDVRTFAQFSKIRQLIKKEGATYSADPARYKKRIRAAFSIWLRKNNGTELQMDNKDFTNNNHTPEEFEYAIHYAMLNSDGWIWLYSVPWLNDLPKEYLDAVDAARKPHRLDYDFARFFPKEIEENGQANQEGSTASAKGRPDCEDAVVWGGMREFYTELYDFPKQWKFRFDPENIGTKKGWHKKYDPKDWLDIEIGDWYGCQLNSKYAGYVWYRKTFDVPKDWHAQKKILLAFGAIDEQAWIWVNGKKAGESIAGPFAWNSAFEIDITKYIKPGKENVVAVRVYNSAGPGGIWKSVKIFAPKSE